MNDTTPTHRNVLVRIESLTRSGYAFGKRVDTEESVFFAQLLADKADLQPDLVYSCSVVKAKPDVATTWRAVAVQPAKARLQPVSVDADDVTVDDRILLVLRATGRCMTAGALAEAVYGSATHAERLQDRIDYLAEMNQVLMALVFRPSTEDGDEDEVYGLSEFFAGVTV